MTIQQINVGSAANDGKGDNLRAGAIKINANFAELDTRTAAAQAAAEGAANAVAGKVDKVSGMGLSARSFTQAEKDKLAGLEAQHYRGTFATLAALTSGVSSPVPGDYADVDTAGADAVRYSWDASDSKWVSGGSATSVTAAQVKSLYESNPDTNAFTDAQEAKLDGVAAGATANASNAQLRDRSTHTGTQAASTISDFASTVRGVLLAGLGAGSNAAIAATDSILGALAKLQAQIAALKSSFTGASASAAGAAGQVPAPAAGDQAKFLRGDGTWGAAGASWGAITGTIGDQADLKSALDSKPTASRQQVATAAVCFNGTNTPTILGAFNVSSVTKVSTGIYDINFATAMDNTDFVVLGTPCDDSAVQAVLYENGQNKSTRTVNKVRVVTVVPGGSARDFTTISVAVFRGKN